MGVKILGTGSYLPPKEVSNDDLALSLDTSDDWIFSHTGIHSRHIAGDEDCTSAMAVKAARQALEAAQVKPEDVGAIILATSTPDFNTFPATACVVQRELGCVKAAAYDLQAACTGFIYALEQARGYLGLHPARPVLVIGAETLSRVVDWTDRGTCILFGDGAGAMVLGATEGDGPAWITHLGADGTGAEFIAREGGTRFAPGSEAGAAVRPGLTMNGRPVFNFAVKTFAEIVEGLCSEAGVEPMSLDRVFAHQANGRIIEAAARRMRLPMEKFFMNIVHTGNTSAASVPIALDQAVRGGVLKDGMRVVMAGFGAGLTYGGTLLTWPGQTGGGEGVSGQ